MASQWVPKILLVEDSPSHRDILKDVLEGHGFEVFTAANGDQALESLEAMHPDFYPDLIVTDVKMPVMDGLEMVEKLAQSSKFRDLSVIIYSGSPENMGVHRGKKTVAVVSIEEVEKAVEKRVEALRYLRASEEAEQVEVVF